MCALTSRDPQCLSVSAEIRLVELVKVHGLADVWNAGNGLEWRSRVFSGLGTRLTVIRTLSLLSLSSSHTHIHKAHSVEFCRAVKCRWTVSGGRWSSWCHSVWPHCKATQRLALGDRKLRSPPWPRCCCWQKNAHVKCCPTVNTLNKQTQYDTGWMEWEFLYRRHYVGLPVLGFWIFQIFCSFHFFLLKE